MKRQLIMGLSIGLVAFCGEARGAATAPAVDPGVPASYKSEADPAEKSEIVAKIDGEIMRLANDADAPGQSAARDWLVSEAMLPGAAAPNTSPGYIFIYTDTLNKGLLALMKNPQTTVRVRVNTAIVAARVADATKSSNLLDTVKQALADKSPAVAQWGETAAGKILPAVFQNITLGQANANDFLNAMVNAVATHSTRESVSGDIADETYAALTPSNLTLPGPAMSAIVDAIIKLQQTRGQLYDTGIPESPDADTRGSLFLLSTNRWPTLTAKQQLGAMQNAVDITWSAAQRAAELPANQSEDLIHTLNHEGLLIESLANGVLNSPALAAIAQPISKLGIGDKPATITAAVTPLYAAVQQSSPVFAELKAPKDLVPLPKAGK